MAWISGFLEMVERSTFVYPKAALAKVASVGLFSSKTTFVCYPLLITSVTLMGVTFRASFEVLTCVTICCTV